MYSLSISCTCLHLSVSDRASHGTLLVDIEGKKKSVLILCICFASVFRSSLGETTSATSQSQSLSKALEEKPIQGNAL